MEIVFYLLVLIILFLLIYLRKNKSIIVTIICTLLILEIIIAPKVCIDGAISGSLLFFYKVFPSLFSFLVVSNIILSYDGIYIYSKLLGNALCRPLRLPKSCSFVLMVSVLCGYPLGAKYACDIYDRNIIDVKTCERLLNIASNASPLFMLGSVGISMLKSSYIGYIFLLSNAFSCFIMGLMLPSKIKTVKIVPRQATIHPPANIGDVLKSSIENSIKTCLSIGGFVTLFSVLNNILKNNYIFGLFVDKFSYLLHLSTDVVEAFILGIIEMTNGCSLISASSAPLETKIAVASFLFTFSGLSIISQVYSFTYKLDVSMKKYTLRKAFQGLICSFLSTILYKLSISHLYVQTFYSKYYINGNAILEGIFIVLIILLIAPWFLFKTKKLLNIS